MRRTFYTITLIQKR